MSVQGTMRITSRARDGQILLHAWHDADIAEAVSLVVNLPLTIAEAPRAGRQSFGPACVLRTLLADVSDPTRALEICQAAGPTELSCGRVAAFIVASAPDTWEPVSVECREVDCPPFLEVVISADGDRDGTIEVHIVDEEDAEGAAEAIDQELARLNARLGRHFIRRENVITMRYTRALLSAMALNP